MPRRFTHHKGMAILAALCCCITMTACNRRQEKENVRFGMDLNRMNPLIMTAMDTATGETVFSRDPSVISGVMDLFEDMKTAGESDISDKSGILFTMSTMKGTFSFGTCNGTIWAREDKTYKLDHDYSGEVQRLYERMKSETNATGQVSREKILSVTSDMTYKDLLASFGDTLKTAVVGKEKALLYQYNGRPFYILYDLQTDTVGMSGEQLLSSLHHYYNLGQVLTQPEAVDGEYLFVYIQLFDSVIQAWRQRYSIWPDKLMLDTTVLLGLDDAGQQELMNHLRTRYRMDVVNTAQTDLYVAGEQADPMDNDYLIVRVEEYSFVGSQEVRLKATARIPMMDPVEETAAYTFTEGQWTRSVG